MEQGGNHILVHVCMRRKHGSIGWRLVTHWATLAEVPLEVFYGSQNL